MPDLHPFVDPKGRPAIPFDAIEPGQDVGSFSYALDEKTVRRHLLATQQEPYPGPWAPVSLLAADGVNLADRHFDISQSVHAGQKLEVLALPRLGATLTVGGRAVGRFVKRGRRYVEIATETHDQDGVLVARGVTTGVVVYAEGEGAREGGASAPRTSASGGARPVESATQGPGGDTPRPAEPPTPPPPVLEELPPLERTMTREAMVLYEPEGERNLHTDDALARAAGLPASIATGTLFLAYLFDLLYRRYGMGSVVGTALDARIRAPVFAGDRVVATGCVVAREGAADRLEVACTGPRGPVITGTARVARAR